MGSNLIIVVFAVVVVSGMGSILGSVATGIGLGLIEGFTRVFYPKGASIVVRSTLSSRRAIDGLACLPRRAYHLAVMVKPDHPLAARGELWFDQGLNDPLMGRYLDLDGVVKTLSRHERLSSFDDLAGGVKHGALDAHTGRISVDVKNSSVLRGPLAE